MGLWEVIKACHMGELDAGEKLSGSLRLLDCLYRICPAFILTIEMSPFPFPIPSKHVRAVRESGGKLSLRKYVICHSRPLLLKLLVTCAALKSSTISDFLIWNKYFSQACLLLLLHTCSDSVIQKVLMYQTARQLAFSELSHKWQPLQISLKKNKKKTIYNS